MPRKKWKDIRATASPESIARAERETEMMLAQMPSDVQEPAPEPTRLDSRYPLRGTVIEYVDPTAPVMEEDWEALQTP